MSGSWVRLFKSNDMVMKLKLKGRTPAIYPIHLHMVLANFGMEFSLNPSPIGCQDFHEVQKDMS